MRTTLSGIVVLILLTAGARADEEKNEQVFKETVKLYRELAQVFEKIKTKEQAEKAKASIEQLDKARRLLSTKMRALSREEREKLAKKYRKEMRAFEHSFRVEMQRIRKDEKLYAVLKSTALFRQMATAEIASTRLRIRAIEVAVNTYYLDHKEFPSRLELLLKKPEKGNKPYLQGPDFLKDIWGRPIQYDAKGPKHGGLEPDIWSLGPDGNKSSIIGNWPTKEKEKK